MTMKKITSLALSGALALSLSAPAFAADPDTKELSLDAPSANTTISVTTKAPTIKVTIPQTGAALLNPYKMSVKPIDATGAEDASGTAVQDQILSPTQYITNESDVAVSISADITGKPAKNVSLANADWGTKPPTTNSVFMYFQILNTDDNTSDVTWDNFDAKSTKQAVVATTKVSKPDMVTLAADTDPDTTDTGDTYAAFHFGGKVVEKPAKAWTAADTVDVTIAFSVAPVANETA